MRSQFRAVTWAAALAAVAAMAGRAAAQGTIYFAGDGVTTVVKGREVCGTTPLDLNQLDGASYATASASEFADVAMLVRASVPNPMGRNSNSPGPWGATVSNPSGASLRVTRIEFDCGAAGLFSSVQPVQPATGWSATANVVSWSGSIDVPRDSALDFIARVEARAQNATAVPVTVRATTAAGVLVNSGHVTSQRNNNTTPYVSLPFVESGVEVYSGTVGNGGSVASGSPKTFTVRVRETENSGQPVPAGSTLTITVPPGWSALTASSSQTGFGSPAVVEPSPCTSGSVTVATTTALLDAARDFRFSAIAPGNQGSIGVYPFQARFQNPTLVPAIDVRTEFSQAVTTPPPAGTRAGLSAVAAYVAVPNPSGHNRNAVYGAALANPGDLPVTVTEVRIDSTGGSGLFRAVTGINPATGWTRVSATTVRWAGAVLVEPHAAFDFLASVQANTAGMLNQPVQVTVRDSLGSVWVNSDGATGQGGGTPAASLYYLVAGQPSLYVFGIATGQPRQFQVVVEETQSSFLNAGAELRVEIPAGWSAVSAAAQAGWSAPVVVQPGPAVPGEVRASLTSSLKDARRVFTFTATAPPDLIESVFLFPTTLRSAQVNSICQALVQVIDTSGGLEVRHLSRTVTDPVVNQIDVQVVGSTLPDTSFRLEILNLATGAWEPLASGLLGAAPAMLVGSVTRDFPSYFDGANRLQARVASTSRSNHRLDEDLALFIVSNYRLVPAALAPPTAPQGRLRVPMEHLRFEVEIGLVELRALTVAAVGSDVLNDVALVHLFDDPNCNGVIDLGELELAPAQPLGAAATATFDLGGGTPLLAFSDTSPACAVVAFDVALAAGVGNLVGARIASGFDLTSDVGPYPFPCPSGYPASSGDVLITAQDSDGDGLTDAEESGLATDGSDADTDDDGLLDGDELGGDAQFNPAVDTDPLVADTDGDGLPDGLESGTAAFSSPADGDGDGTPDVADPEPADPAVKSTDQAAYRPDLDPATRTGPLDDDSDDDGLVDGSEDLDRNGRLDVSIGGASTAGSGDTDPAARDTDQDGIGDGVEAGLAVPQGSGTDPLLFVPDADPATATSPIDVDSDDDGVPDGVEDSSRDGARAAGELDPLDSDGDEDGIRDGVEVGVNGLQDPGETSALVPDTDADGLHDGTETGFDLPAPDPDGAGPARGTDPARFQPDLDPSTQTNPLDDDTDDDGLLDGVEDASRDGVAVNAIGGTGTAGAGETDPRSPDSDGDGCQDGTESGLVAPQGTGTNAAVFRPDAVPALVSDPLDRDSDDDGVDDGAEDANCDGALDPGETDPSGDPSILRNDELASLALAPGARAAIFTGSGATSLVLAGANRAPDPGEGADPTLNGSDDDDDLYARRVASPWSDPDAPVADAGRPLVFYQVSVAGNGLRLAKSGATVRAEF